MKLRFPLIAVLLFALAGIDTPALTQMLPFVRYTTSDGLQSNRIRAISQDMRGYLWIGTNNGISLYDGISFHPITTRDGLSNEYISGIIPSRHDSNVVWIGTLAGGVSRYDRGRFSTISFGSTLDSNNTIPLIEDAAKRLWVATTYDLYVIEEKSVRVLHSFGSQVRGLGAAELDSGRVAIALNDSFYVYDVRSLSLLSRRSLNCPPGVVISDLLRTVRGKVWALLSNGDLVSVTENVMLPGVSLSGLNLLEMYDGKDGSLWFASQTGVYQLYADDQPTPQIVPHGENKGFPQFPGPVFVDMEYNLWVGSWESGLVKLTDPSIVTLLPASGKPPERVIDGTCDSRGHIWMLTGGELVEASKERGSWRMFHHDVRSLTRSKRLIRVLADGVGRIWVRPENKSVLSAFTPVARPGGGSTLQRVAKVDLDFPDSVLAGLYFLADRRNRLWCAIENDGGLVVYDIPSGRMLRHFTVSDGIPKPVARLLFEDRDLNIWCGGFDGGLSLLPHGDLGLATLTRFGINEGLPDESIRSMTQDREGRLWVGTRFGGVAFFDGKAFVRPALDGRLRSNAIWAMTEDSRGTLWLGTDVGLESINRISLKVLPERRELARNIVMRAGSYRDEFIWAIAPDNAIVYAYPESQPANVPPPIYIERMLVNGRTVDSGRSIRLAHDENNCVIDFIGISFRDPQNVRYQYRLGNTDPDWSPQTDHHSVTYANLEPGEYTFSVRAINGDGVMSTNPASMSFVIAPALWQRWWFLPLLALLAAGIASMGVRRRFLVLKRERTVRESFSRQLIDSQENERKRIAGELHDSLGQNLLIIKNQAMIGLDSPDQGHSSGETLRTISDIASQSITEVREIAYNLRPYLLDKLGLTKGIQSVVRKVAASSDITFQSMIEHADGCLSLDNEIHLYRVIQEGLNNIVRHSAASRAAIELHVTDTVIRLTMDDDGKGFDASRRDSPERPHGFGIAGMTERVRILGGTMEIRSAPGKGTHLSIIIPVENHEPG